MSIYHKHHIIPRHMGGSNDPNNLIKLTVEEHAEAHRKLFEQYGHWQDELAWKALSKQITKDEARRISVSKALKGKPKSKEHIEKMTAWRKNTYFAPTLGKILPKASPERKNKISESLKGRPSPRKDIILSEETKQKMSVTALKREKIPCSKCGKQMPKANLVRHESKCFLIPPYTTFV